MTYDPTFFLRYCVRFLAVAFAFTFVARGFSFAFLPEFVSESVGLSKQMSSGYMGLLLIPLLGVYFVVNRAKGLELLGVLVGTGLLSCGFMLVKTTIPSLIPFWADPAFASMDQALFGGIHAYEWSHMLTPDLGAYWVALIYMPVWVGLMLLFPAFVVVVDKDNSRKARYLKIYFYMWLGLGLVLATVFSSAGPAFHDRLFGGQQFSGLSQSLSAVGLDMTGVIRLQEGLWRIYEVDGGQQLSGGGISAFPSMHAAMAAVWAAYLSERSPWLAPVGFGYLAVILYLSVFTGWHYAVDGIASAILIVLAAGAPALLRRFRTLRLASGRPDLQETVS